MLNGFFREDTSDYSLVYKTITFNKYSALHRVYRSKSSSITITISSVGWCYRVWLLFNYVWFRSIAELFLASQPSNAWWHWWRIWRWIFAIIRVTSFVFLKINITIVFFHSSQVHQLNFELHFIQNIVGLMSRKKFYGITSFFFFK